MTAWNKPCELEDFSDPQLKPVIREIFPQLAATSHDWPKGYEYRKHWEVGMAVLAAKTLLLKERRQFALGVGAGTEATTYYLTNQFRWVFATDLYVTAGWPMDSPPTMLVEPEHFAHGTPFQRRRLVVQHMDARQLDHEDETFDLIYSCSSIEHFGTREQIKHASREMGRVLKRQGLIAISTEYCIRGTAGYLEHDTLLLSQQDLEELIIEPTGCLPVDGLRFEVSDATLRSPVRQQDALRDRVRMHGNPEMSWSQYPHILLEDKERVWTSYHLTLRKPD